MEGQNRQLRLREVLQCRHVLKCFLLLALFDYRLCGQVTQDPIVCFLVSLQVFLVVVLQGLALVTPGAVAITTFSFTGLLHSGLASIPIPFAIWLRNSLLLCPLPSQKRKERPLCRVNHPSTGFIEAISTTLFPGSDSPEGRTYLFRQATCASTLPFHDLLSNSIIYIISFFQNFFFANLPQQHPTTATTTTRP